MSDTWTLYGWSVTADFITAVAANVVTDVAKSFCRRHQNQVVAWLGRCFRKKGEAPILPLHNRGIAALPAAAAAAAAASLSSASARAPGSSTPARIAPAIPGAFSAAAVTTTAAAAATNAAIAEILADPSSPAALAAAMAAVEDSDYAARTVRDAFGRYLAGPVALGAAVPDPPAPPAPLPSLAGRTVSSGYAAPAAGGEVKRRVS